MITKYDFRNNKQVMELVDSAFGADYDTHDDIVTAINLDTINLLKKYNFKVNEEKEKIDNENSTVSLLRKISAEAVLNTFKNSGELTEKIAKCTPIIIPNPIGFMKGAIVLCLVKSTPNVEFNCFPLLAFTCSTYLEKGYLIHISEIVREAIKTHYAIGIDG